MTATTTPILRRILRPVALIMLALAAIATSCTDGRADRLLRDAEAVMEQHPDSALAMLRDIDGAALKGELRARHALLLSQALDKNFIDIADDSLINIACDYYTIDSDATDRYALTQYYKGVVDYNSENYHSAIFHLTIADSIASYNQDFTLRGKACALIALSMSQLTYLEDELVFSQKSLDFFTLAKDSLRASDQRLNIAACYAQLGSYDKALDLLNQPECTQNNYIRASCLLGLGRIRDFENLSKSDSAIATYSKIQARYSAALARNHHFEESERAFDKAILYANDRFDSVSCLVSLATLYREKGMWHEYALCSDSANAITSRSLADIKNHSVPIGITNAREFIRNAEKMQDKRQRDILAIWIAIGTTLCIIISITAIRLYRKNKRRQKEYTTKISILQSEYREAEQKHRK